MPQTIPGLKLPTEIPLKIQTNSARIPALCQHRPFNDRLMILYFAADLLWASRIKATADALGLPARPVRNLEMLNARFADSTPAALVADLDKPDIALALIAAAANHAPKPRIVAWGPHVEKDTLQRARDAGADEVLTRGAFDHNLEEILLRLAASNR